MAITNVAHVQKIVNIIQRGLLTERPRNPRNNDKAWQDAADRETNSPHLLVNGEK